MRRESSTVVVVAGEFGDGLLAGLTQSPNVSVARAPDDAAGQPSAAEAAAGHRPGGSGGSGGPGGPAAAAKFEERAAEALAAWRDKRFELPDYYLVVAPPLQAAAVPDLYLGPLRAVRPRRVAVAGVADSAGQAGQLLDTLRSLEHGPWWPPLDELLDAARHFYAGGLAEAQRSLV